MPVVGPTPLQDGLVFRVCRGPTCDGTGETLGAALAELLSGGGHTDYAVQAWQSCFGQCAHGPNVVVERWRDGGLSEDARLRVMLGGAHPDYRFEHHVTAESLPELVHRHIDGYLAELASGG